MDKIQVTYIHGDKKIVIEAADRQAAEKSFQQIVAEYFPHLNGAQWVRAISNVNNKG